MVLVKSKHTDRDHFANIVGCTLHCTLLLLFEATVQVHGTQETGHSLWQREKGTMESLGANSHCHLARGGPLVVVFPHHSAGQGPGVMLISDDSSSSVRSSWLVGPDPHLPVAAAVARHPTPYRLQLQPTGIATGVGIAVGRGVAFGFPRGVSAKLHICPYKDGNTCILERDKVEKDK